MTGSSTVLSPSSGLGKGVRWDVLGYRGCGFIVSSALRRFSGLWEGQWNTVPEAASVQTVSTVSVQNPFHPAQGTGC